MPTTDHPLRDAHVDKSAPRIRRMFAEIAGGYDRMNHLLSLGVDRYWRWRTAREVRPEGEEPILDLCCGTGDLALAYFRRSGGRVPIVGADFCREMLVIHDRKRRQAGAAERIALVEADAMQLPFADAQFQIVAVAFGLRNVSDADQALREMVRVLRPAGRLAVLEFSMPTLRPLRAAYGLYFRRVLPRVGRWLAGDKRDAYNYLPASVAEFPAGEALAQRMRDAGLGSVRFRPLTLGVATLYVGVK
jgi:demethylmenaquinone methyltransferase / 2-methoxy-6-polyprenyl-1,4-benzoquinol methylase